MVRRATVYHDDLMEKIGDSEQSNARQVASQIVCSSILIHKSAGI